MSRCTFLLGLRRLGVVLALVACSCGGGGGDASSIPPEGSIGTLAYVLTECRDEPGFVEHQELRVRHGDREVTVAEVPDLKLGIGGLCRLSQGVRLGLTSVARGTLTRLAVSPDGSVVVFEITSGFSDVLRNALPPEREGIFLVRADGTGLRRLGPPSRQPPFSPNGNSYYFDLVFSPDGRLIAFTDAVADSGGVEMGQIVTIDLATGARTQVTHLPPTASTPQFRATCCPGFLTDQTIIFSSLANPDGLNSDGADATFTIKTDGSNLRRDDPPHVAAPGAEIDPTFRITGDRPTAGVLAFPDTTAYPPLNHIAGNPDLNVVLELFLFDGPNLLQLSNFRRIDTFSGPIDVDRQRVFFSASANPPELHGSNPTESCQIFSVDRTGSDLRQLTFLKEGEHSVNGCDFNRNRPGCAIIIVGLDPFTQTLLFYSSCDPFGTTNGTGAQIFAMRSDGNGLRQLTHARGAFRDAAGVFHSELPGPIAYGPYLP